MASLVARGAFILFEGVDRCGKTTQSTKLVEALKSSGVNAELWRYPDRTTSMGQMINSYLQSKTEMDDGAIHLLFAANRWEKRAAMEAKLAEAKRRLDEVDATRRALEAEAAAITLEDLEEDDEGAEVWGEASEDDD